MKITICGSLDFSQEIGQLADQLKKQGHSVFIPATTAEILSNNLSLEYIKLAKKSGEIVQRAIKNNAIRNHYEKIKSSDAILVANYDKKGIKNYIGGNTFLEMGFAHVLNKKIFLLHGIPEVSYKDEILAMPAVILNEDLDNIK